MVYRNREGYPDPTPQLAINGVRWEELQRMREKQHHLKRGEIVTLYHAVEGKSKETVRIEKHRIRIIELYKNHVLTENRKGIRQCYDYWKLEKLMRKPGGENN